MDKGLIEQFGPKGLVLLMHYITKYQDHKIFGLVNSMAEYSMSFICCILISIF